jgi:hypothetical protein
MEMVFDKSDVNALTDIIEGKGVDDNAIKLLRVHAFIDVRLDILLQDFNQNDPDFLNSVSTYREVFNCKYFDPEKGFAFPNQLNFSGKIYALESFKFFPKAQADALYRLNKVRNRLAHDYKQSFTMKDLNYIFQPVINDPNYVTPDEIKNDLNLSFLFHVSLLAIAVLSFHQSILGIVDQQNNGSAPEK